MEQVYCAQALYINKIYHGGEKDGSKDQIKKNGQEKSSFL